MSRYSYGHNYKYDSSNPPHPRDNSAYEKNRAEHARGVGTHQTYNDSDSPNFSKTLIGIGRESMGAVKQLGQSYYDMGKGLVNVSRKTVKGAANMAGIRTPSGLSKQEKKQITRKSTSGTKGGKRHLRKKTTTHKRGKKTTKRNKGKKTTKRNKGKK